VLAAAVVAVLESLAAGAEKWAIKDSTLRQRQLGRCQQMGRLGPLRLTGAWPQLRQGKQVDLGSAVVRWSEGKKVDGRAR